MAIHLGSGPLSTSYVVHMGKKDVPYHKRACFRDALTLFKEEGFKALTYNPYITKASIDKFKELDLDYEKLAKDYWKTVLELPFVAPYVKTVGALYSYNEGQTENGIRVDCIKAMPEKWFTILQMLRLPQEKRGSLYIFSQVLETTGNVYAAVLLSNMYSVAHSNSKIHPMETGHAPTNRKFCPKFIRDFVVSGGRVLADKEGGTSFRSNFIGDGTEDIQENCVNMEFEDALAIATGKPVPHIGVAVYGSLRSNMGNNALLRGAKHIDTITKSMPMKMYSMGAFPCLCPDREFNKIVVELYKVTEQTLKALDALEGYPNFYNRTQFLVGNTEYLVYFIPELRGDLPEVEGGDWKAYKGVA